MRKKKKCLVLVLLFALLAGLVGCDGATKWMAAEHLRDQGPVVLSSNADLRYVENHDVSFQLLSWISPSVRYVVIVSTKIVLIASLLVFLFWVLRHSLLAALGLTLILAGALGNFLDRIFRGYVVDFIHLHVKNFSWPVFNVADICICVGVALMGLTLWQAPPLLPATASDSPEESPEEPPQDSPQDSGEFPRDNQ